MASLMGGGDGDDLLGGSLDEEGGGGDNLKARVKQQLAQMMNKRRAGMPTDIEEDEF